MSFSEHFGNIKVINFHAVQDAKWFENIVVYLKNEKQLISCDDLTNHLDHGKRIKPSYLLTVDDGERSFYDVLYPVIKKHQVPIAIFVSPKMTVNHENFWFQSIANFEHTNYKKICADVLNIPVNKLNGIGVIALIKSMKIQEVLDAISMYEKKYKTDKIAFQNMNVKELLELKDSGLVTIGAHTMNHPILFNEDDSNAGYEVKTSIDELNDLLNEPTKYFAYPNGIPKLDYSQREVAFLKEKDIKLAFSTDFKKVIKTSKRYEIPRGEISNGKFDFRRKLFLWEYWNYLANYKNKNREHLKQRKDTLALIQQSR